MVVLYDSSATVGNISVSVASFETINVVTSSELESALHSIVVVQ